MRSTEVVDCLNVVRMEVGYIIQVCENPLSRFLAK